MSAERDTLTNSGMAFLSTERDTRRNRIKLFVFLAFTMAFTVPNYSQYQLAPLAVRIMEQYSLTNGQFTSVFAAPMVPAIFLSFISGILVDKYGFKILVGISIVVTAIGCILRIFVDNYTMLYISMILTGVSAGIISSNSAKIIGSVFSPEKVGVIVGLGVTIGTGMMIIAMSTTAIMPSTKFAFILAACLGLLSILLWHAGIPKRRQRSADELAELPSVKTCLKTVLANKYVWFVGIGLFCVCGAMVGMNSLISAALSTRGMSEASSGAISAFTLVGNLLGSLVMPTFAHKTGKLRLILVLSSIVAAVGTAISWLMPFGVVLYAVLLLTGLGVGSVLPQLMAICIKLPGIGTTYAGTAGGFAATLQLLGGVIIPTYIAAAIAGDNFYTYFIITGAFMVICAVTMALLPKQVDK